MTPDNETIKAIQRQLDRAEAEQKFWNAAKAISIRGGTIADIMALGDNIDETLAKACLDRNSVMYHSENMNVSARKVNFIKKKLAMAIKSETERMKKRGLL